MLAQSIVNHTVILAVDLLASGRVHSQIFLLFPFVI
jgi:hypothetical protein